ncbi:MAG: hypothetical protein KGY50_03670 [Candidatus Thermoplasmatota archaeon]|nr:hypothetical protein [Candidatus Thermoplasmatota archaeon]
MNYISMELGSFLTRSIIQFIITLIVGAFLLHLATGVLGFKKRSLTKAAIVVIIGNVLAFFLSFIPLIGQIIGLLSFWFIIKKMYDIGWIRAIIAWIMSILVAFSITAIILFLLGISIIFIP